MRGETYRAAVLALRVGLLHVGWWQPGYSLGIIPGGKIKLGWPDHDLDGGHGAERYKTG